MIKIIVRNADWWLTLFQRCTKHTVHLTTCKSHGSRVGGIALPILMEHNMFTWEEANWSSQEVSELWSMHVGCRAGLLICASPAVCARWAATAKMAMLSQFWGPGSSHWALFICWRLQRGIVAAVFLGWLQPPQAVPRWWTYHMTPVSAGHPLWILLCVFS